MSSNMVDSGNGLVSANQALTSSSSSPPPSGPADEAFVQRFQRYQALRHAGFDEETSSKYSTAMFGSVNEVIDNILAQSFQQTLPYGGGGNDRFSVARPPAHFALYERGNSPPSNNGLLKSNTAVVGSSCSGGQQFDPLASMLVAGVLKDGFGSEASYEDEAFQEFSGDDELSDSGNSNSSVGGSCAGSAGVVGVGALLGSSSSPANSAFMSTSASSGTSSLFSSGSQSPPSSACSSLSSSVSLSPPSSTIDGGLSVFGPFADNRTRWIFENGSSTLGVPDNVAGTSSTSPNDVTFFNSPSLFERSSMHANYNGNNPAVARKNSNDHSAVSASTIGCSLFTNGSSPSSSSSSSPPSSILSSDNCAQQQQQQQQHHLQQHPHQHHPLFASTSLYSGSFDKLFECSPQPTSPFSSSENHSSVAAASSSAAAADLAWQRAFTNQCGSTANSNSFENSFSKLKLNDGNSGHNFNNNVAGAVVDDCFVGFNKSPWASTDGFSSGSPNCWEPQTSNKSFMGFNTSSPFGDMFGSGSMTTSSAQQQHQQTPNMMFLDMLDEDYNKNMKHHQQQQHQQQQQQQQSSHDYFSLFGNSSGSYSDVTKFNHQGPMSYSQAIVNHNEPNNNSGQNTVVNKGPSPNGPVGTIGESVASQSNITRPTNLMAYKGLWVCNVSPEVSLGYLKRRFRRFGHFTGIQTFERRATNGSNIVFVHYDNPYSPMEAIATLHNYTGPDLCADPAEPLKLRFAPSMEQSKAGQLPTLEQARKVVEQSGECFNWRLSSGCHRAARCQLKHVVINKEVDSQPWVKALRKKNLVDA